MINNFHKLIMNIPIKNSVLPGADALRWAYSKGHRDARHAAAEIALLADARIRELEQELADLRDDLWHDGAERDLND